jgi:glutaminyl-tRNA synthetase
MAVLRPLKVVITNYPGDASEQIEIANNPEDPSAGTRSVPFSSELWIEADDFMEEPPKKFFRLAPGREVRLRGGYFLKCERAVKDAAGAVTELRCTIDPATRGGQAPDGRKVKGTIHWVSAAHALRAEVRLYETLFTVPDPDQGGDYRKNLNPKSLESLKDCLLERSLAGAEAGKKVQFERHGYFCVDPDSRDGSLVFNRTVSLRDTWAKIQEKE